MSGKRKKRLNRTHPDCAKYRERFDALYDTYIEKEQREKEKYPGWNGNDHPASRELRESYRQLCREIQALQKEFDYLLIDAPHG